MKTKTLTHRATRLAAWYALFLLGGVATLSQSFAAGPGLEVSGSGFVGLSPSAGPFNRTFLSQQVTQVTPIATVRLDANRDLHDNVGFNYVATFAGEGSVTYGAFTAGISFELQAKPQSVTTSTGELQNSGHSELEAHMNLKFSDSGVIISSSLPGGTPVNITFKVVNQTTSFISEPEGIAPFNNPYPNGNHAGLNSNGTISVFDETSLAEINGALSQQNNASSYTFNTAVGHRIDLTVNNFPDAYGYGGYIGLVGSQLDLLFYPNVNGTLDSTTQVTIEMPSGVSFAADSGHSYAAATSAPHKLGNISTRGVVGTGDNVMIGGFIVTGSVPKKVLVRAIGPSLTPFGVPDALADPALELHGPGGALITSNDNWKATQQAEVEATGIAPTNDLESAIIATLAPGAYTAITSSKNGVSGVGLVEIYDLDQTADAQLANISTRGFVGTESHVMIGGFILGGGSANTSVVVRALGPSLTPFGVTGALADPTLELRNGNGDLIRANDNWKENQQTEIEATGLQPSNDLESAVSETLPPGAYTAIVAGKDGLTGVALVEVYRIPEQVVRRK